MNQVVPPRFLFRWAFPGRKIERLPNNSGRLLELPDECLLPDLTDFDGRLNFAAVKFGWNDGGLGISIEVSGKSRLPRCDDDSRPDGLRLWFDTRNTQSVHRATKFCSQFDILPSGGGAKRNLAVVRAMEIARAREDVTVPDATKVSVQSEVGKAGYWLEAWFPLDVLVGFDPAATPKIGFHYLIHDSELGDQSLSAGSEFPYESDPSLWQTIDLLN